MAEYIILISFMNGRKTTIICSTKNEAENIYRRYTRWPGVLRILIYEAKKIKDSLEREK